MRMNHLETKVVPNVNSSRRISAIAGSGNFDVSDLLTSRRATSSACGWSGSERRTSLNRANDRYGFLLSETSDHYQPGSASRDTYDGDRPKRDRTGIDGHIDGPFGQCLGDLPVKRDTDWSVKVNLCVT